jgi:hypothetical protein
MGGSALNKGCIKNLVAVASSNLDVALGDLITRQMALRTPPGGGVKTLATRAVRAAHAGPASSAMYTWLFVQESRAQVRVRNSRNDGGECLLRKGVQGLLGDLGA